MIATSVMTADIQLEYAQLPSLVPTYLRAATRFGGGLDDGATIPVFRARVDQLRIHAKPLARYCRVCGFTEGATLPITYPHVLGFPLQMTVITHRRFPLKVLGLIQVRNEIIQYRRIAADEPLTVEVGANGHRDTARGVEFDLVTRVSASAGERVWEETGTMLSKRAPGTGRSRKSRDAGEQAPALDFTPAREQSWSIPGDIGRRYAQAAGDYNPIHLSRWSARLFGFPKPIATGMWTMARAAAAIEPELDDGPRRLTAVFKKPVLLPARVRFMYATNPAGADFAVVDESGETIHLLGDVRDL